MLRFPRRHCMRLAVAEWHSARACTFFVKALANTASEAEAILHTAAAGRRVLAVAHTPASSPTGSAV